MRRTGLAGLCAAGLLAGAAGGVVLSMAQAEPGRDTARPVPAVSPSVPVDPPPATRPDTDSPALQPGLAYERSTLGAEGSEVGVRTPVGWKRVAIARSGGEAKWFDPDNRLNTYLLRIELVEGQRQTVEAIREDSIERITAATDEFRLLQETANGMRFVYVDNGLTRFGFLEWVADPASGHAVVEVAAHGRARDRRGLLDLVSRAAGGVRL